MIRQFVILAILVSVASASTINFQVTNQTCPTNANFLQVLYNLPNCIVESFFNELINGFVYASTQFLNNALAFIANGPDLTQFCPPYTAVMQVIESLYTIALMGVGAYFIVSSADPIRRATAKLWLENLFLMIILLAVSFSIFQMILEVNTYITTSIYNQSFSNLLSVNVSLPSLVFAFVLSASFSGLTFLTFSTLLTRYLMIPFLLLLFPFGIFLYFIPFTKEWGSFILKFSLLIIFMTSIDAILIAGLSFLMSLNDPNITGGFVQAMTIMLGVGLIGIVNTIIYLIATFSLISGSLKVFQSGVSTVFKLAFLASLL